jgi:outer membrane protein TolC
MSNSSLRGFVLTLSAAALLAPAAAFAQIPTITLADAIRLSAKVNPSVVQAIGTVRNSEAAVRSASLGAYLPSLTGNSSANRSFSENARVVDGEVIGGGRSTNSVNLGLSANMELFTGFRRGADSKAAKANRSAAEASLTDQEFQVGLTVTQQFFDALAAQQLITVREASVKRAEEQLNLSVAKLRVGSATRSDSLRSLVNLGNARLALVQTQSDVARTQAVLGRSVGFDARVAAADDSAFYEAPVALDTAPLSQEALEHSPTVRASFYSADAARAQLRSSRSAYWPTLSLSASTNWSGTNQNDFSSRDSLGNPMVINVPDYHLYNNRQISLGLSWTIFNRFQREQTIVNRLSALDVAEATARDTRRGVQSSLTTQYAALDAASLRIDITSTSVLAAAEDLRVVNERYRVGAATILDVLTSQEALQQAEVDVVNARFDYLRAKAQLEALIGRRL